MSKNSAALHLVLLLLTFASSIEARAGLTISDRRYWPSEARGNPGQVIEIPLPYAYPRSTPFAAEPLARPPRKTGRTR